MNRGTYRLVFNEARGAWVAVCEWARGRGKRSVRRRTSAAIAVCTLCSAAVAEARAPLPRPLPVPAATFVSRGAADLPVTVGRQMTIRQETAKAVLNWNSFDIEAGHRVTFSHPNAAAATLNKIGGNDPSVIRGALDSVARDTGGTGGAIYLVNRNGILFAEGAQVNVGGLIASALDIADDVFEKGLLSVRPGTENEKAEPVFVWAGDDGQYAVSLVAVEQGASIATSREGRVMLLAPRVTNAGEVSTPQGQTVLAAGGKVYLATPASGSKLRGFLVEVDPGPQGQGGVVENLGRIVAERGNITLAALAVNQRGRLTATTTVDMNGSIYLQARDTVAPGYKEMAADGSEVYNPLATRMGTLTLGAGSVTEVLPETASTRSLRDDQVFNKSEVVGSGKTIVLEGATGEAAGARIAAPAGEVSLTAQGNLSGNSDVFGQLRDDGARVYLGDGATIDVAGLRDVPLSVSRNVVEVELRGNELKDAPLQRKGILAGKKVLVDIRKGTPLADVSGYVAGVQRGIAEKSAAGGTVNLKSEGDVILRRGSTVDVSGGSLDYAGGDVGTTRLTYGRRSVDIGDASPLLTYTDYVKDTYRYESGYVEGKDAGTLAIVAGKAVLDGQLKGSTRAGIHQRELKSRPTGGRLVLEGLSNPVAFVNDAAALAAGFGATDPLGATPLLLGADIFNVNGFNRLALATTGAFSLPDAVRIEAAAGGDFHITAEKIDVHGSLATAGGRIALKTTGTAGSSDPADAALVLGPGAMLSTAGTLVSDLNAADPASGPPIALAGGRVSLDSAGDLTLAASSHIDVSGGAWQQANGKVKFGNAGTVSLATGTLSRLDSAEARMTLAGEIGAYGRTDGKSAGQGGALEITASNVRIGGAPLGQAGELHLDEGFFQRGGFARYAITARDGLSVASGARVQPRPQALAPTWAGDRGALSWTSVLLPDYLAAPTHLALTTLSRDLGDLRIGRDALLGVTTGGSIRLTSPRSIEVEGRLQAPAGEITLAQTPPRINGNVDDDVYQPERAIWLGAHSQLLAKGVAQAVPNANGAMQTDLRPGGTVDINAAKGYLIMEKGALIDVSGTTTVVQPAGGPRAGVLAGSPGGAVKLAAREGMLLDGDFLAQGGVGAPGGSLSLDFRLNSIGWQIPDSNPQQSNYDPVQGALKAQLDAGRNVVLKQTHEIDWTGLRFGQALDPYQYNGVATIAADKLMAAGFADVALKSESRLSFDGTVALATPRSLALDAPNFTASPGADVSLMSRQMMLGNADPDRQEARWRDDATSGNGRMTAIADHIVLAGASTQQGFATATLNSVGDIEARGVATGEDYKGAFVSAGDIHLNADRIYPATLTDFAIEIHNNPQGRITTGRLQNPAGAGKTPLSAGGRLALVAPHVSHGGTLMAPFGTLELRSEAVTRVNGVETRVSRPAGGTVTLAEGSVTSVAGEGQTLLFGQTQLSGEQWTYPLGPLVRRAIEQAPEKRILLDGDAVTKTSGATVDLSGGGDLLAWEFIPGPGGSKDVLDPANSPNTYALLPAFPGRFAPYDLATAAGAAPLTADRIVLKQQVGDLAAGEYLLLPARYALLPGAYTVTFTGQSNVAPGAPVALPGGGWQVAAHRGSTTLAGTALAPLNEAVEIVPGAVARTRSEYIETKAGEFFAGGAGRLPGDAGQLAVNAGSALSLAGSLNATHAATHRSAEVDIAATKLAVRGSQSAQASYSGFVTLDADSLNALGAESLALGGLRSRGAEGIALAVTASEVIVDNAGSPLAASDLILAAKDRVTLAEQAVLSAAGGRPAEDLTTAGDGALLRLSGNGLGQLTRTGNPAGATGVLDVKAGALLTAEAVTLDATKDSTFAGQFGKMANGDALVKALALGANRISLGNAPVGAPGLVLDDSRLAALDQIEILRLKSYSTLDLYGAVATGNQLKTLEIQAAGIAGRDNAGKTATLTATNLSLSNPDGIVFDAVKPAGTGSGTLNLTASGTLTLGKGDFKVDGFAAANLNAREIKATGRGSHDYAGDLTLAAGRITASADARQKIAATGKLATQAVAQAQPFAGADFGGQLTLAGATLRHGGRIDLPAGIMTLQATAGDLELLAGASINAAGASKTFADKTMLTSGGTVVLESAGGNVVMDAAASVDVAGAQAAGAGSDAGRLEVRAANGTATLAGTLSGHKGASDAAGGEFLLDAGSVAALSALSTQLAAGGFDERIEVRARAGDMTLAQGATLKAQEVNLATDDGNLTIAGTIDASGKKGGSIALWANRGATANTGWLTLEPTALLKANATEALAKANGTRGEGGTVTLGVSASNPAEADQARLVMLAGSQIDVSAAPGSAAAGGKVTLRAPRVGANDMAISGTSDGNLAGQIGTVITGASSVVAEAVRIDATTGNLNINTTKQTAWKTDTAAFMANAAALKTRLGWSDAAFQVRPGLEARASGDITLANDWNLWGWRDGGVPGALTLRAEGDIKFDASLSDGFSSLTATTVGTGDSWSYRLVAGAAGGVADPLALKRPAERNGKGSMTLAANKFVRTGTGSIDVVVAGDLTADANATIYTAGKAGAPVSDFAAIHASNNPSFPTGGGDLNIRAQGNIAFQRTGEVVVDWLWRQGRLNGDGTLGNTTNGNANNTAWWINFPQFKDGVGTLGGGDATVIAGGDMTGLSVSAPTNARLKGAAGTLPSAENLVTQGGGDVKVVAGGHIADGEYYAAAGGMKIKAGETFGSEAKPNTIALGDSIARVQAGSGAWANVVDPFLLIQAAGNVSPTPTLAKNTMRISYFSNYTPTTQLMLTALTGDVTARAGTVAPATLELAALGGALDVGGMTLAPAPLGNLGLFASESIRFDGSVIVPDSPVSALASPLSPKLVEKDAIALGGHGNPPLHAGDPEPVRVVALEGNIQGAAVGNAQTLYLPKRAFISAGGDIVDLGLEGQHLHDADVTRILSGGSVIFNPDYNSAGTAVPTRRGIELGGPGRIEIIAQEDVDLGMSKGIVTRGNFNNPFLDDKGASIQVLAGAKGADHAGFLAWLDEPAQAQVRQMIHYQPLGSEAAREAFLAQPQGTQRALDAFFAVLRAVGREVATTGRQDYDTGYAAIAALFPAAIAPREGDIKLYFSQIKTEQGGGIDLLAPSGMINVGLAAGGSVDKKPSELGIITARGGNIRALVRDDLAVNQSRIFTLQGGDILAWSSQGDIDAGRGSKTAASTPPPQIIVRGDQIILDTSNSVSGSGIGVLLGKDGIEAGSVDLIAPKGTVNAGDAGIRALGDVYLAAAKVVGADNIQAGGKQVGVPQVEAAAPPPPPPPAAEAAKAADAATAALGESSKTASATNSILTVEVLGLGEDEENKRRVE